MPWGRTYSLTIPGCPTGGPYGKQGIVWNDEFMVGEIAQVGTQFDGLGHIGLRDKKEGLQMVQRACNFQKYPGVNPTDSKARPGAPGALCDQGGPDRRSRVKGRQDHEERRGNYD